jgi:hypothetical protein
MNFKKIGRPITFNYFHKERKKERKKEDTPKIPCSRHNSLSASPESGQAERATD